MGREFPLTPRDVPQVTTTHRRIVTPIPAPASIPRLEQLRKHEPASMGGQPPIIWHEGDGFYHPRPVRQPVDRLFGGGARRLDGLRAPPGDGGDEAAARDRAVPHLLFRERAADRAGREARGDGAPAAGKGVPALDGFRGDGVRDEARVHVRDSARDRPRRRTSSPSRMPSMDEPSAPSSQAGGLA